MSMKEYNKIETLFNRDLEGTKKLIFGSYRNETVEFLKDCQWDFTEKIDGTNVRVHWDGHKVTFGGRTDGAQIPAPLVNKLNDMFGGSINEELFEQKFGEMEVTLYGEGYGPKIAKGGGLYRSDVSFILFDVEVLSPEVGYLYLKREAVEDIAKFFNIDVVPIILTGTLNDGVDYVLKHPKSTIGTADMEGLVARPKVEVRDRLGKRVIVKIKWKDLKEFAPNNDKNQVKLTGF